LVEPSTIADRADDARDALVACATCGAGVDPLRAERVAFVRERFRYFCSASCRERYDMNATGTPLPVPRADQEDLLIRVRAVANGASEAQANAESQLQSAKAIALVARTDLIEERNAGPERLAFEYEGDAKGTPSATPGEHDSAAPAVDVGGVLLLLAGLGAVLSIALILAGDSSIAEAARLTVMMVAALSLAAESLMGARQPTELHPAALLAAPLAGSALALGARLLSDPHTGSAITVASVVIACVAGTAALWIGTWVSGAGAIVGAAAVMGVAVTSMHYTGMAALRVSNPAMAGMQGMSGVPVVSGATATSFVIPLLVVLCVATFVLMLPIAMTPSEQEILADREMRRRLEVLERR